VFRDTYQPSVFSFLLGLVACACILGGYFLPWIAVTGAAEQSAGISAGNLQTLRTSRAAQANPDGRGALERLQTGEQLRGSEWEDALEVLSESDQGKFTEKQRRLIAAAHWAVRLLPWAAAAAVLLLVLTNLPPRAAMKAGLAPVAAVVAVTRLPIVSSILLVLVMSTGLVVTGLAALLLATANEAASVAAREGTIGLGLQIVAAGGIGAFLAGTLGFRSGSRMKAIGAAMLLLATVAATLHFYVTSGAGSA